MIMKYFSLLPFICHFSAADDSASAEDALINETGLIHDGSANGKCLDIVGKKYFKKRSRRSFNQAFSMDFFDDSDESLADEDLNDFVPFVADDLDSFSLSDDVEMFKRRKGKKKNCNGKVKLGFTTRCQKPDEDESEENESEEDESEENEETEAVKSSFHWSAVYENDGDKYFKIQSDWEVCLGNAMTVFPKPENAKKKKISPVKIGALDDATWFYRENNLLFVRDDDDNDDNDLIVGNSKKTGKIMAISRNDLPNLEWGQNQAAGGSSSGKILYEYKGEPKISDIIYSSMAVDYQNDYFAEMNGIMSNNVRVTMSGDFMPERTSEIYQGYWKNDGKSMKFKIGTLNKCESGSDVKLGNGQMQLIEVFHNGRLQIISVTNDETGSWEQWVMAGSSGTDPNASADWNHWNLDQVVYDSDSKKRFSLVYEMHGNDLFIDYKIGDEIWLQGNFKYGLARSCPLSKQEGVIMKDRSAFLSSKDDWCKSSPDDKFSTDRFKWNHPDNVALGNTKIHLGSGGLLNKDSENCPDTWSDRALNGPPVPFAFLDIDVFKIEDITDEL